MRPELIKCVVFDFAGTLCSCPYFRPLGPAFLDLVTERIFGKSSEQWADPWMRGDVSRNEIAAYLSQLSGLSENAVLQGLYEGCRTLRFNKAVWEFAKAQRHADRRTVLATLNMDVFSQIVVPSHSLSSIFDVIVNTSDFGTLKKDVLWQEAFRRLGDGITFSNSLLIDDSPLMVSMFRDMGGVAHQYTNDGEFQAWLAGNEFH
jgi:FMN phosphatase YigB (HAD superfamily)